MTSPPRACTHAACAGVLLGAVAASGASLAQTASPAPPPPAKADASPARASPFKLFRYDEDYSALADPALRTSPLDNLKYIALNDDGTATLSLGGESRSRYEYSSAPFFGLRAPGHDDYFLQRFLLHADLHLGPRDGLHARAFVQLLSGLVAGEEMPKPGNQDNALDLQQAFGELIWGDNRAPAVARGSSSLAIRAGRQEMGLGSYRLVTSREPTNARLAFDGVRATAHIAGMTFDAFLLRPVDHQIGLFNDGQDDNTTFWGFYSSIPLQPERRLALDLYYMGLERDQARFQPGVGDELRHSLGARLWGRALGWDHDTEAVLQFGTFDQPTQSLDILAWTIASNTGYTFEHAPWSPRLGLKLNIASGDRDPTDSRLGTFNPLFPRNNYFSDANLLAPYNFFDVHPSVSVRPMQGLTLTAAWDSFFRFSTRDAVFAPAGIVIPATASSGRYVGSTLSLVAEWAIDRHLTLTTSYAHFFRGQVVRDAGGKDVDFFAIWLTAKF
jgi:hypothetical protein